MAEEEGAFPVQIVDFGLNSLQTLTCHHFLEPLLHTLLVMLLCQLLHCVHQLMGYPMIHQLQKNHKPTITKLSKALQIVADEIYKQEAKSL